jgi:hypothetical protein
MYVNVKEYCGIFCSGGISTVSQPFTLYIFMYLRAILCTFQISVHFHYVPVGWRGGGRGGAGEGGGQREGDRMYIVWVQLVC